MLSRVRCEYFHPSLYVGVWMTDLHLSQVYVGFTTWKRHIIAAAYGSRYQGYQKIPTILENSFWQPIEGITNVLCLKAVTKGAETYFMAFTRLSLLLFLTRATQPLKKTSVHLPIWCERFSLNPTRFLRKTLRNIYTFRHSRPLNFANETKKQDLSSNQATHTSHQKSFLIYSSKAMHINVLEIIFWYLLL